LNEDQSTYDQYNKVPNIKTAIIIYADEKPVAIGCFKEYNEDTVEIKRMYVDKAYRGKGISKMVLNELEKWATEKDFHYAILETSIHFITAQNLYKQAGYIVIPNYDQYEGLKESICMKKKLQ
jgi:GNAT superfamily N-acetyltransferase